MVRKVSGGYKVYSEKGKPLSKTYPTKQGAQKRLNEIEYFKTKKQFKALARVLFTWDLAK